MTYTFDKYTMTLFYRSIINSDKPFLMNNFKYLDGTRIPTNSAHLVEDLKKVLVRQVARHDDVVVDVDLVVVVVVVVVSQHWRTFENELFLWCSNRLSRTRRKQLCQQTHFLGGSQINTKKHSNDEW